MSGPYKCLVCGGHGLVERGFNDDTIRCDECNGTGEAWPGPCVFSPSKEDRDLGRVEYVDGRWRFKEGMNPYLAANRSSGEEEASG